MCVEKHARVIFTIFTAMLARLGFSNYALMYQLVATLRNLFIHKNCTFFYHYRSTGKQHPTRKNAHGF